MMLNVGMICLTCSGQKYATIYFKQYKSIQTAKNPSNAKDIS